MCNLCSSDIEEKAAAVKAHLFMADRLASLSGFYAHLARGSIDPHSDDAKKGGLVARSIIRELVEEWV